MHSHTLHLANPHVSFLACILGNNIAWHTFMHLRLYLPNPVADKHAHTTHTCTHTVTYTHAHKHTHMHTNTYTQTHTHAHKHIHACTQTHKHIHACTQTHTHTIINEVHVGAPPPSPRPYTRWGGVAACTVQIHPSFPAIEH